MATTKQSVEVFDIPEIVRGRIQVCILGTSPLLCNRMPEKAMRQLLAPPARRSKSQMEATMKHEPILEFRASPYILRDPKAPTLLAMLPTALKSAMRTAALDLPGAKKAQVGRLVQVNWDRQPVFGIPKLHMAIVRNSDINHTPDVRTRACLKEWACKFEVSFTKTILREQSILNLIVAAGMQSGIGDWRQEKGSGSYGSFEIVAPDHPDFVRIVKTGGRKAQQEAMDNPECYDEESAELMAWYEPEMKRRGFKVAA